ACVDARRLLGTAEVICAMSVEALLGTDRPFAPELQRLRPHPGQIASAANLTRLLAGSQIVASHRESDHAVQDAYSLRCSPQVLGAARDTLAFAAGVVERELASAVDNPVVLPDGRVESNGNFHGEPLAFAADFLAIAIAEVGAIAERRVDYLLDAARSRGLPPFLASEPGVNSGLMLAQYTAAALVAENRRLAQPASVDSVPTSAMQEDHVSMGWGACLKLRQALQNVERIVAIEAVCAARALDFRRPLEPAPSTRAVHDLLRTRVPGPGSDRPLAPELDAAADLVHSGAMVPGGSERAAVAPLDAELPGRCQAGRALPAPWVADGRRSGAMNQTAGAPSGPRVVRAPRGSQRSCKGWEQEAALRMLMNNLDPDVAERPEELVVYGGTGKAARSWEAFDAIVRELRRLEGDETLLVQSGKPVGVFRTHPEAPRVLLANSLLVPHWATREEFSRLEALGLTMYGQMTAGSWIYIGTQGILQGTYETFAECARQHFGGTLRGRLVLTA